jgi:exopolyphosphatase/guanosine-5'-triphosphate,3'-diphosphate pyrophosphatase
MAKKRTIAALDVGSHEITLKIAQLEREGLPLELETIKKTLAIGTDTYKTGEISEQTVAEIVHVLADMMLKLKEYKVTQLTAAATSAVREARNRQLVLDQIDRVCQYPIRILSNGEERFYHMLATAGRWPQYTNLIQEGTLVLDLGSGSVQVTVFDKGEYVFSQNMRLGALRIRELLADLERRTADFGRLMEEYISTDLENYRMLEPKGTSYKHLIVLGDDTRYLKKLANFNPTELAKLSDTAFEAIYQLLLSSKPSDLAMDRDIPTEHASLLLPDAIMVRKFLSFTGVKSIYMPVASLADGLLIDLARQQGQVNLAHDPEQYILSAARQIVRRYKSDKRHVTYVEKMALQIFDETKRLHRLGPHDRLLLQLASLLHDTGKFVNMRNHNVRSFNIILSTEIVGLNQQEQLQVAWVARLYTGPVDLDEPGLNELPNDSRLKVIKLAAVLRLADSLDASHHQLVQLDDVHVDGDELIVQVSSPEDMTLAQWGFEQKSRLFKAVFGLDPIMKFRRK